MEREFLRPGERRIVAAIVALAGASLALWWIASGGLQGRWVDAERLPKRENRFLVDLNRAGAAELAAIPEVGPALAQRILDFRHQQGPFHNHEQLLEVDGIGPKTLERMRAFLAPLDEPAAGPGAE